MPPTIIDYPEHYQTSYLPEKLVYETTKELIPPGLSIQRKEDCIGLRLASHLYSMIQPAE